MSEGERRARNNNLQTSMENQLFSMLKGVMDDDEANEEDMPMHDIIFNKEDSEEEEEEEEDLDTTLTNTTFMSQCAFARDSHDKSQTTKGLRPLQFNTTQNDFYNNEQLSRKTTRKFQTLNGVSFNHLPNQTMAKPFLSYQTNQQLPIQPQYGTNWNYMTPMTQLNYNQHNQSTFYYQHLYLGMNNNASYLFSQNIQHQHSHQKYNDIEESLIADLETILINTASFDEDNYSKFKGNFIKLIKNQQASRICQFYLDKTSTDIIHMIFQEIITEDDLSKLLYDPYANYFLLKMFHFLSQQDKITFLSQIVNDIKSLCINKISTYPIQCIVEHLTHTDEKILIMSAIANHLMELSSDVYGTHVIEKILSCFDYELTKPITQFIMDNFLYLATNSNGLCIIKKVIIFEYQKDYFLRIKGELEQNALALIENPYGNYALQIALDNWDVKYTENIMIQFIGQCGRLSVLKYSSNVIERCIEKSEAFCMNFIGEVCFNWCSLSCLMKNTFGNYVIQTALKNTNLNNKMLLLNAIDRTLDQLADKNLIKKWKSIVSAFSQVKVNN